MRIEPRELLIAALGVAALEEVCGALAHGAAARPMDFVVYGGALALAVLLSRKKPCVESSAR